MTSEGSSDEVPVLNSTGERRDRIIYKVVLTGGIKGYLSFLHGSIQYDIVISLQVRVLVKPQLL